MRRIVEEYLATAQWCSEAPHLADCCSNICDANRHRDSLQDTSSTSSMRKALDNTNKQLRIEYKVWESEFHHKILCHPSQTN